MRLSDARSELGRNLDGRMSPEQIDLLLTEILAIKKKAQGDFVCKECKKRQIQWVEISDAKSVTDALVKLLDQAWGRPALAEGESEEKIVFERVIYMDDAETP